MSSTDAMCFLASRKGRGPFLGWKLREGFLEKLVLVQGLVNYLSPETINTNRNTFIKLICNVLTWGSDKRFIFRKVINFLFCSTLNIQQKPVNPYG